MNPIDSDWRYQGEHFQQRSHLMSCLIRMGIDLSSIAYEFCDFTISQGWNPPKLKTECDEQVLKMYHVFLEEVKNG